MKPAQMKQSLMIIVFAFAGLIGMLAVLFAVVPMKTAFPGSIMSIVSAVIAVAAAGFAATQLKPVGDPPNVKRFQANVVTSLAGIELSAILGIFFGSSEIGTWPYAVVAWIVIFGLILPRVLGFFRVLSI